MLGRVLAAVRARPALSCPSPPQFDRAEDEGPARPVRPLNADLEVEFAVYFQQEEERPGTGRDHVPGPAPEDSMTRLRRLQAGLSSTVIPSSRLLNTVMERLLRRERDQAVRLAARAVLQVGIGIVVNTASS